jgi:hypothetical protein
MSRFSGLEYQIVQLGSLSGKGNATLVVQLPTQEGRSRVAFIPVGGSDPQERERRARLLESLRNPPR